MLQRHARHVTSRVLKYPVTIRYAVRASNPIRYVTRDATPVTYEMWVLMPIFLKGKKQMSRAPLVLANSCRTAARMKPSISCLRASVIT